MGEKVAARAVAAHAQVPQVPGTAAIASPEDIVEFGALHGYPIAVKASYGGGGRGMRTVDSADGALEAWESARREALAAFGRDEVYLERYLSNARHVEVQVLADVHGNVVWLGDRDCSVQRRHQKLVEEAPAPGLSAELRTAMGEASVRLARQVAYVGAGTVEYLVETSPERFYFLEMNTRIQVEHPVTEATLGLDLVAEQLRVAAGMSLSAGAGEGSAGGLEPRGHAIELRVNAEDVTGGAFRPSPGTLLRLDVPARAGVRFDAGHQAGDEVQPYYDSLIGKLVVWAPTRDHAIDRTLECLRETTVTGVPTTLPAAAVVLDHPDFRAAKVSTRWLEEQVDLSALESDLTSTGPAHGVGVATEGDGGTGEIPQDVPSVERDEVWVAGRRHLVLRPLVLASATPGSSPGLSAERRSRGGPPAGGRREVRRRLGSGTVTSPMQGTLVKIAVTEGQSVAEGEVVAVMEAMKMENAIRAAVAGTVASVAVEPGQVVSAGAVLVEITPFDRPAGPAPEG